MKVFQELNSNLIKIMLISINNFREKKEYYKNINKFLFIFFT
uniref:Uncharacterized protein n=1 Tax=Bostrychia tenella TaxID=324755 RepID=A0A1Z1M5R8_9FLOR|nr:hypothetical protein [Bostrychia tenella]ARW61262.1 hypothetical protein [Bostrychia tenella]